MAFETCANYMVGMNGVDAPFKWSGTGETSVLANAPATGRYPVLYNEKLFCVPGDNLSQIWWSESFAPENWPAINYWGVKDGDGDEIKCLKVFQGDLIIFKSRSTHMLRGTSMQDFRLDEMDAQIGCVGHLAAAQLANRLYFVSPEGLYYFNGLGNVSISANSIPVLWNDIDQNNLDKACVGTWDDLVWFSLPLQRTLNLKITAACSVDGSITIELGGVSKTISLTANDDTANKVADKIRALTFDGWTLSGSTDTIIFTRNRLKPPLELTLSTGTTGVNGTITKPAQKTNNFVIIYDPINGAAFWPNLGINASGFQAFDDGNQVKFYSGDSLNGYVNQQDVGTEDFGNPVSAYWIGKSFDVALASHFKKAKRAYIEDSPDQDIAADFKASLDYGDFLEWQYRSPSDGLVREYKAPPAHRVRWRYLTPMFIHNSPGKCEIRGLTIPCNVKNKPKGRV